MTEQERIAKLEAFIRRLLHPDEFGYSVTSEVRDAARHILENKV
jgi:hypothetical protein